MWMTRLVTEFSCTVKKPVPDLSFRAGRNVYRAAKVLQIVTKCLALNSTKLQAAGCLSKAFRHQEGSVVNLVLDFCFLFLQLNFELDIQPI